MVEEANIGNVVNVEKWLKKKEEKFKPPVCNSIMAGGFLKIMFVGGPNVRKDYHLDQGEELFYMVKGDMCLKIMERGEPKDVHIKEGEIFVLPSRIPHSPQRSANTLGLVIERERADLWDGIRYYCDDGKTILWQKFFHLHSLVKDFPPVIAEYFASEQYKTGKPIPGTTEEDEEKFKVDVDTVVNPPFSLNSWVNENLAENCSKMLFGNGEFKVFVYGKGKYDLANKYETWLWMKDGSATVTVKGKELKLLGEDSLIILPNEKISVEVNDVKGYLMEFIMDPTATPQK
ncbi:3-hydroxyanthranilate 3,4-dioxygenase-like [Hydractinia symbiolongicarpus]|uniref:3-hydroxyanthranilate 3,4-dioxygenase-like n=1 Tax=Hydractinia symbiolongicarpus TaxID=13093 RepID=UPI00254C79C8|nr:3-hydroxyanthranilate 3,4-dioxygenase-like [Hydractinia symbiolongicarpus]